MADHLPQDNELVPDQFEEVEVEMPEEVEQLGDEEDVPDQFAEVEVEMPGEERAEEGREGAAAPQEDAAAAEVGRIVRQDEIRLHLEAIVERRRREGQAGMEAAARAFRERRRENQNVIRRFEQQAEREDELIVRERRMERMMRRAHIEWEIDREENPHVEHPAQRLARQFRPAQPEDPAI
ncbi:hypothetical protein PMAYCL1PPCAC_11551 [Pristionchus mayeri]|uniref:Uncharacterized protein n=1 Tax=Pristionchus mayeri TaxID=1317129 RepID=A0AAN4ZIC4_9BILA|nr:hypothetical protein PMAYCL1PPCAC_11551 [Pristionchus mayeri]